MNILSKNTIIKFLQETFGDDPISSPQFFHRTLNLSYFSFHFLSFQPQMDTSVAFFSVEKFFCFSNLFWQYIFSKWQQFLKENLVLSRFYREVKSYVYFPFLLFFEVLDKPLIYGFLLGALKILLRKLVDLYEPSDLKDTPFPTVKKMRLLMGNI